MKTKFEKLLAEIKKNDSGQPLTFIYWRDLAEEKEKYGQPYITEEKREKNWYKNNQLTLEQVKQLAFAMAGNTHITLIDKKLFSHLKTEVKTKRLGYDPKEEVPTYLPEVANYLTFIDTIERLNRLRKSKGDYLKESEKITWFSKLSENFQNFFYCQLQ